jgi:Mg-chelatase subunit ChlD
MSALSFAHPEAFLLVPVLVFLGWWQPRLRLRRPMRVICLLLLTLVLAGPRLERPQQGLDLIVLVDRSDSAAEALGASLAEQERLLARSLGPEDTLRFIDFAADAQPRSPAEGGRYGGPTGQTRLALAVRAALLQRDPDRPTRLLVLTDGQSTEPLDGLAGLLRGAQVPLDYRLALLQPGADAQVRDLALPTRVRAREPFVVEGSLSGEPGSTAEYALLRDGQRAASGQITFNRQGRADLRLADRLGRSGAVAYTLRVFQSGDPRPGNNRLTRWVEARAAARVLLVTRYAADPLADALSQGDLPVELVSDPVTLNRGRLSGAGAVILHDVPFTALPGDFAEALPFYVREQGGGLLMVGGRQSFGIGGYARSEIGELLPVSMELKEDERKLAVALALVLDRSGSMGAQVGGSGAPQTKMDLANAGAINAIELLAGMDAVTVLAVDSEAHTIVPLSALAANRATVVRRTGGIQSMGGGIFVYTGLQAAWKELRKAQAGQRHIVLFSDAADSEEPGDYVQLIETITDAGGTVSVIGLGTENDVDAPLLEDIARLGKGRIYFTNDAARIPALFSQETVTIARSRFNDAPVAVTRSGGWSRVGAREPNWPAAVGGFNVCYPREGASVALLANDEDASPLVAVSQEGAGRTAAITFPLAGDKAGTVLGWDGYGGFARSLTRWLSRPDAPAGLALRTHLEGNRLQVTLFADTEEALGLAAEAPVLTLTQPGSDSVLRPAWEVERPGLLRASAKLDYGQPVFGVVRAGRTTLPFGPVSVGQDLEWRTDPLRLRALRQLSASSGGVERVRLPRIWEAPRRERPFHAEGALVVLLVSCIVVEALLTRLSMRMHKIRLPWRQSSLAARTSAYNIMRQ